MPADENLKKTKTSPPPCAWIQLMEIRKISKQKLKPPPSLYMDTANSKFKQIKAKTKASPFLCMDTSDRKKIKDQGKN
jgi:hypothetical protein